MIRKTLKLATLTALSATIAGEAFATEWNVSLWGKRRAFTEHVEILAELVSAKTNGDFTLNLSYGGLSKNRETLTVFPLVLLKWHNFVPGITLIKTPQLRFSNCRFWVLIHWKRKLRFQKPSMRTPLPKRTLRAGMPRC